MIGLHVLPLRASAGRLQQLKLLPGPEQRFHPYSGRVQALLDLKIADELRLARDQAVTVAAESIARALAELDEQVDQALQQVADLSVELGLAVAREVVGRAAEQGLVDLIPVVKDCLSRIVVAPSDSEVLLKLHPQDQPGIVEHLGERAERAEAVVPVRIVPDPSVERGEVVVETGVGRLSKAPLEVLDRLTETLRQELHKEAAQALQQGLDHDPFQAGEGGGGERFE